MTSGAPRAAFPGSANRAPCPVSAFINGSGLISLLSAPKEAGSNRAWRHRHRKSPRGDRLLGDRGARALRRHGIAARDGFAAKFGLYCIRGLSRRAVILVSVSAEPRRP